MEKFYEDKIRALKYVDSEVSLIILGGDNDQTKDKHQRKILARNET